MKNRRLLNNRIRIRSKRNRETQTGKVGKNMSEMIYNCAGMEGESLKSYIRETLDFARPEDEVSFILDNATEVKEVEDYAIAHDLKTEINEEEKGTKITLFIREKDVDRPLVDVSLASGCVVVLNSSRFGQGNPRLGEKLMKKFLNALEEGSSLPETIVLYNSAVVLLTEESACSRALKRLEHAGVDIAADKDSAEFYDLKDKFVCGRTMEMEELTQLLMNATKVIKL